MNWRDRRFPFTTQLILAATLALGALEPAWAGEASEAERSGDRFHQDTSLTWSDVAGNPLRSKAEKPAPYKTYPGAKRVKLPKPAYRGITVEEALERRRSVRNYSGKPLRLSQLSQLLFAAQGITGKSYDQPLRTAPSAGALYPFEIYVVANDVEDLPNGIYHHDVLQNQLELLREGDFSDPIASAGLEQEALGKASATFVLSAVFERTRRKYGERGLRYVYIEAGHISENIALQAVSLGLGSVTVGAFIDADVNQLIGADGQEEAAIYLHAVGAP